MMEGRHNQFNPESVDTDIDTLLQIQAQTEIAEQKHVPLIRAIHEQYLDDPEVLDRAWKRVIQRMQDMERQTMSETPISIQDYFIEKESHDMQDQGILRSYVQRKTSLKRRSGIVSGVVAALLIASAIMIFIYHQQSLPSHSSQTTSQHPQTQVTAHQAPAPGTKVPGPAAHEIQLTRMGIVTIKPIDPNGEKITFTTTEDYTFHIGQNIGVQYVLQPQQENVKNGNLRWYQNSILYKQEHTFISIPSNDMTKDSETLEQYVAYSQPGLNKVEIYWDNQLAWTIYFAVK